MDYFSNVIIMGSGMSLFYLVVMFIATALGWLISIIIVVNKNIFFII